MAINHSSLSVSLVLTEINRLRAIGNLTQENLNAFLLNGREVSSNSELTFRLNKGSSVTWFNQSPTYPHGSFQRPAKRMTRQTQTFSFLIISNFNHRLYAIDYRSNTNNVLYCLF